ncbi:MAG: GNAT family N-acetyltransferase [Actinomycetota bacterium]|nr:GNAT family N-acetyltransferase [Actinomycetota bacterium]
MPPTMLTRYDQQIRRNPDAGPEGIVERDDRVIRCVSAEWTGVSWSDLDAETVDAAISRQLEWFHGLGRAWEWKHYSGDGPTDLPDRLLAAGFVAEPSETLLVAEIADLELDVRPPAGVTLEPVVDAAGAAFLVRVHDEVFGGDHSAIGAAVLADLDRDRRTVVAILAMAGDRAVSCGRLEFVHGTDFAGIWGGGTLPEWRGRGVFRSLVAYRARLALDAGFRYLQVDATADSRPILNKLGFVELATTTPFVHPS